MALSAVLADDLPDWAVRPVHFGSRCSPILCGDGRSQSGNKDQKRRPCCRLQEHRFHAEPLRYLTLNLGDDPYYHRDFLDGCRTGPEGSATCSSISAHYLERRCDDFL